MAPDAADDEGSFDLASPASVDAALAALGFAPIGNLICERLGDVKVRGFARSGPIYGVYLRSLMSSGVVEFFTSFEDGATLTTSTNDGQELPHKRLFKRCLADAEPAELLAAHEEVVAEIAGQGAAPVEIAPTLEGLARSIDDYMVRFTS